MSIKITSQDYAGQHVAVNDALIAFDSEGNLLGIIGGMGLNTLTNNPLPIEPRHLQEMKMRPKEFNVEVTEDESAEGEKTDESESKKADESESTEDKSKEEPSKTKRIRAKTKE